ncbi:sensor histidine kinase [Parasphingorhabdus pacifica]
MLTSAGRERVLRWLAETAAVGLPAAAVLFAKAPEIQFWTALFACAVLPLRHRWPRVAVVLCVPGLACGMGWPPAIVALFKVGWVRPHFWSLMFWVLVASASALAPVLIRESLDFGSLLVTISFVLFAAGSAAALGALVQTRRQLTESLARLREVSEAEAFAKAETARADERARITREIHDAVGHHVTLIAIESAALAATSEEPETAESAGRLRGLAKEALAEMRTTLGLVRAGGSPDDASARSLSDLVARARETGLDVRFCGSSDGSRLAAGVGRAAYRVVQEALTNASKHAPGAEVVVDFDSDSDDEIVRIAVTNGAPLGKVVDIGSGGSGLAGLSERVRTVGGQLETSALGGGGFQLVVVLPKGEVPAADVS